MSNIRIRALSLGAGVQSTTLALMAAHGAVGPMPDCAIFADTIAEPIKVYDHLRWLMSSNVLPFPVHIISAGDLRQELLDASEGIQGAWGRPPLFVRNDLTDVAQSTWNDLPLAGGADELKPSRKEVGRTRRQCTQDYKLEPIIKEVRRLAGLKPRQRGFADVQVEQWIGISLDEVQRMSASGHRWIVNRYPLVEARMTRGDCVEWLRRHDYPIPPKSSCTFCPFHTDTMWRDMKLNDPKSWADAVHVDRSLRTGKHLSLKGELYLHRSLVPLDQVDFRNDEDRGQLPIGHAGRDPFANDCLGMCGL